MKENRVYHATETPIPTLMAGTSHIYYVLANGSHNCSLWKNFAGANIVHFVISDAGWEAFDLLPAEERARLERLLLDSVRNGQRRAVVFDRWNSESLGFTVLTEESQ